MGLLAVAAIALAGGADAGPYAGDRREASAGIRYQAVDGKVYGLRVRVIRTSSPTTETQLEVGVGPCGREECDLDYYRLPLAAADVRIEDTGAASLRTTFAGRALQVTWTEPKLVSTDVGGSTCGTDCYVGVQQQTYRTRASVRLGSLGCVDADAETILGSGIGYANRPNAIPPQPSAPPPNEAPGFGRGARAPRCASHPA